MNSTQFTEHAPGRLVPTTLKEKRVRNGMPELIDVRMRAFMPDPLPPHLDWGALKIAMFDDHSQAVMALGRLNGLHKRLGGAVGLLRTLWMREAKLSSEIEGIETTAEEMVLAGAGRSLGVRSQGRESWNYVKALEHGIESELPLCCRLIKEMHGLLLTGVRGDEKRPGQFRSDPVFIGDPEQGPRHARFIPIPPGEALERAMGDFERFAHECPAEIPPLFAVAMMHYQFEALHPFRDGNGRIGRVLISRSLVKERLLDHPVVYMSAYINEHKREYVDRLLAVSTHGEWERWIRFMIHAITTQSTDAIVRSEALINLRQLYLGKLTSLDASANLVRLLDRLFRLPALNAAEVCEELGVTPTTAYRYLDTLEKAGVLREHTGRARNRDWIAPGIVSVINTNKPEEIGREVSGEG